MGIHQHIPRQPRSEFGGPFRDYRDEQLEYLDVERSDGFKPRKLKTRKHKRTKNDESVVIVFHDVSTSFDVHMTIREAQQRLNHYKTVGKPTDTIERGLSEARRVMFCS